MSEIVTCQETKRLMETHGFSSMVAARHLASMRYLQRQQPNYAPVYHRSVTLDAQHLPTPNDSAVQTG
jgi:hypothetical protein